MTDYAIQNEQGLFWSTQPLYCESGKRLPGIEGWVKLGFNIYDETDGAPSNINPPEGGRIVTSADVMLPADMVKHAIEDMERWTGGQFSEDEIRAIAKEGDCALYILRGGGFDTGEREVFGDALMRLFTGRDHWPTNSESYEGDPLTELANGVKLWREIEYKFPVRREITEEERQRIDAAIIANLGAMRDLVDVCCSAIYRRQHALPLSVIEAHIAHLRDLQHELTGDLPIRYPRKVGRRLPR